MTKNFEMARRLRAALEKHAAILLSLQSIADDLRLPSVAVRLDFARTALGEASERLQERLDEEFFGNTLAGAGQPDGSISTSKSDIQAGAPDGAPVPSRTDARAKVTLPGGNRPDAPDLAGRTTASEGITVLQSSHLVVGCESSGPTPTHILSRETA